MRVRVKKLHPDAVVPKYAKPGDAGLDLVAISCEAGRNRSNRRIATYGTGLAFEIPEGYVGLVFPRSSISRTDLLLTNSVGVIDSGYRGEITFKFIVDGGVRPTKEGAYQIGDRIGQLVIIPYPKIELELVESLSETERGEGGYGSSGR